MPNVDPALRFRFSLDQQLPRLGLRGITRAAPVNEFPVLTGIAGGSWRSRLAFRPGWRTSEFYFFDGLWPEKDGNYGPEAL
ncbi:hypothetical protein EXU85_06965 [Spirosoma sp. KCTC 42546]|uniref:hypothetical protein n=1 Tax=Spirosoma sp. KCTC 42546 TaxID=2520506 RepID=UPI00115AE03B|nr:hypothetical protein [Spirosoma sp. KCTC 42546]QDK78355.1 hypothetical protein EXU85_06965 [Spirosoma sp. KCTC 42546]